MIAVGMTPLEVFWIGLGCYLAGMGTVLVLIGIGDWIARGMTRSDAP